jgi:hypothetical protein
MSVQNGMTDGTKICGFEQVGNCFVLLCVMHTHSGQKLMWKEMNDRTLSLTLTSFHWKKTRFFHLARKWLSPLCLWYLTKEICRLTFTWNELQFVVLFAITEVNNVLS